MDALKHDMLNDTEFGLILRRCHLLLRSEPSFKVVHVRINANKATHAIARWSRPMQTPTVELKCPVWLVGCLFKIYF